MTQHFNCGQLQMCDRCTHTPRPWQQRLVMMDEVTQTHTHTLVLSLVFSAAIGRKSSWIHPFALELETETHEGKTNKSEVEHTSTESFCHFSLTHHSPAKRVIKTQRHTRTRCQHDWVNIIRIRILTYEYCRTSNTRSEMKTSHESRRCFLSSPENVVKSRDNILCSALIHWQLLDAAFRRVRIATWAAAMWAAGYFHQPALITHTLHA